MTGKRGVSLTEIMIATLIIGIAVGPIFILTRSTSESSRISGMEIMACNYAEEISSQLNRYLPDFPLLIDEVKANTPGSDIRLEHILTDKQFLQEVKQINDSPVWVPFQCNGFKPGLSLYLSPLHVNFVDRTIKCEVLDTAGNQALKNPKKFLKVSISLSYVIPSLKNDKVYDFSKVMFVYYE